MANNVARNNKNLLRKSYEIQGIIFRFNKICIVWKTTIGVSNMKRKERRAGTCGHTKRLEDINQTGDSLNYV
jgi:hypothetical protein